MTGAVLKTINRVAIPAIVAIFLMYLVYQRQLKNKRKATKENNRRNRDIAISTQVIREMEIEVNFTIKVAYLKFQE